MTEADILHWIRDTSLGVAVRQSRWMFATGETLHFLGLSLLVCGILIVFAGLSVWALSRALDGMERAPAAEARIPTAAKVSAIASIVFWCGAIVAGRLIGYTIGPPPV